MPTEAEWEVRCRGGPMSIRPESDSTSILTSPWEGWNRSRRTSRRPLSGRARSATTSEQAGPVRHARQCVRVVPGRRESGPRSLAAGAPRRRLARRLLDLPAASRSAIAPSSGDDNLGLRWPGFPPAGAGEDLPTPTAWNSSSSQGQIVARRRRRQAGRPGNRNQGDFYLGKYEVNAGTLAKGHGKPSQPFSRTAPARTR